MNLEWMIRGGEEEEKISAKIPRMFWRRRGRLVNDHVDTGHGRFSLVRIKWTTFSFGK